jgi:hypothetical protein
MTTDFRALCAELLDEVVARPFIPDSELISRARAALAEPKPEGPTVMEIIELADEIEAPGVGQVDLVRAALARWGNLKAGVTSSTPVPVSERLPEPNTKVLAHYFNALGKGRTICAIWVPAKSRSDDADYDFTEYDEEDDKFYWPEGWYEAIENWDDLGWVEVDEGEVVYWQPLPKWPATALPPPAGKVEK